MLKKITFYNVLAFIAMVLLCVYTYRSILVLGFEQEGGAFTSIIHFVFVVVGLLVMLISIKGTISRFSLLWLGWMGWLIVDFFVLGLRGNGAANIFHVLFCPMVYLFFFETSFASDKIERIAYVGFVVLFIIAFIMNINNLSYNEIDIGEDTAISNLVYWCLCAVPFLFLTKKSWIQVVFLILSILIVLLTGKRSASTAIVLIVFYYLFDTLKGKKHGFRNLLFIIIGSLIVYYIISYYFLNTFWGLIERVSNIVEDQGSGRIPLYMDVFRTIETNSFSDWFVGRGYGSIAITRHTNAHNDALQLLFEYGLVGLVFYIVLLWNVIKRTVLLIRMDSHYYMGYVVSLIIFVVLGAVSNLVVFYSYFAFICAYWGIVEADLIKQGKIKRYQIVY